MIYQGILDRIGFTPLVKIEEEELDINLYAKLEYYNPTGSVKDRAANYIIEKLIDLKEINQDTLIVESSSGNFGIALSACCKKHGLKFCCVVDPHITPVNEMLIRHLNAAIIKVTTPDGSGGYLLKRIEKVKEIISNTDNAYWVNQYGNPYNAEAYYHTLGNEICDELDAVDYIFMGVSSGGTITGVSQKIKKRYPNAKVIAVDIIGSVIFGGPAQKRYIPGIGSGMIPDILKYAKIDDVVMMDELTTIRMCHNLLKKHYIFAGGSSGSVFGAVKRYFSGKKIVGKPNVVIMFPDKGDRYINTIYNDQWCSDFANNCLEYKKLG